MYSIKSTHWVTYYSLEYCSLGFYASNAMLPHERGLKEESNMSADARKIQRAVTVS